MRLHNPQCGWVIKIKLLSQSLACLVCVCSVCVCALCVCVCAVYVLVCVCLCCYLNEQSYLSLM